MVSINRCTQLKKDTLDDLQNLNGCDLIILDYPQPRSLRKFIDISGGNPPIPVIITKRGIQYKSLYQDQVYINIYLIDRSNLIQGGVEKLIG